MAKKKSISGLEVNLLAGTTRTLYAVWNRTSFYKQNGYRVVWKYKIANRREKNNAEIWLVGNDSNTSSTTSTYSAPETAIDVSVTVAPSAKSFTAKEKKKKKNWTGVGTTAIYNKGWKEDPQDERPVDQTPSAPSSVEIEVTGKTVKAKVTNYYDEKASTNIRIQIIKNDSSVVSNTLCKNEYGIATATYTIPTNEYGNRYKARAQANGKVAGKVSQWSNYTANKYAAPANVTNVKIKSTGEGAVDVSWSATSGAKSYKIEYTSTVVDGKPVFDTGSSSVQSASDIIATHYPASSLTLAVRWYFRVRATGEGGDGAWSDTASHMTGTKPDKPSTWSYTTIGKIGTPIVFNWIHSSKDGSDQSGVKIAVKINDGNETITTYTSGEDATKQSYTYNTSALSDSDKISWRISTRGTTGIENEWSDYSEYREIVVYAPPSINFTVGVADEEETLPVVKQFPINISGLASPGTQTPVSYYVSITSNDQYDISGTDGVEIHVSEDEEIYSMYIPSDSHELSLDLNPGDIYLNLGSTYTVTVTVAMTNGLTAESSQQFMAKWDIPSWIPDADVSVDLTTLVAYIRPFCSDEWGFEYREGFILAVYRMDFDGQFTEIMSDIPASDNSTVTDLHPSLDYARYRIVATDLKTGMIFYEDVGAIAVGHKGAVIQWNGEAPVFNVNMDEVDNIVDDWSGTVLDLPYNINVSDDISPDVSLVEYIGRKHPVSYYGTQQGSTSRWTVDIPKHDTETLAKVRALAIYPGDVYVREPYGTGYWANIKTSYSISYDKPVISVSFTISRVEGGA